MYLGVRSGSSICLLREMAERIAVEEEKKRKRAEKFGTGVPAATNGSAAVAEPVSVRRIIEGLLEESLTCVDSRQDNKKTKV